MLLGLLCHFAMSFSQHHFCNIILIRRIILIFRFGQIHRHRPHSCPCRQQLGKTTSKIRNQFLILIFLPIEMWICGISLNGIEFVQSAKYVSRLTPVVICWIHLNSLLLYWTSLTQRHRHRSIICIVILKLKKIHLYFVNYKCFIYILHRYRAVDSQRGASLTRCNHLQSDHWS